MAPFALGMLALSFQAFGESPTTVYRYIDASGQEHFVNDPSFAPPEVRATLQPMNLDQAPATTVAPVPEVKGSTDATSGVPAERAATRSPELRNTWLWASLVAGLLFVILLIASATVPSRFKRLSWSLYVGRFVSVMLLIATLVAATYELRNDPAMRRYSPWAALDRLQSVKLGATQHAATEGQKPDNNDHPGVRAR
jgi:hypothetical protein